MTLGGAVALAATAAGSNRMIASVEFHAGQLQIGLSTAAPYTLSWNSAVTGKYVVTAKATSSTGVVDVSSPLALSVNIAPTASLLSPLA